MKERSLPDQEINMNGKVELECFKIKGEHYAMCIRQRKPLLALNVKGHGGTKCFIFKDRSFMK